MSLEPKSAVEEVALIKAGVPGQTWNFLCRGNKRRDDDNFCVLKKLVEKTPVRDTEIAIPFQAIDAPEWRRNWKKCTAKEMRTYLRKQVDKYLRQKK